jgi:hypothetical protein
MQKPAGLRRRAFLRAAERPARFFLPTTGAAPLAADGALSSRSARSQCSSAWPSIRPACSQSA